MLDDFLKQLGGCLIPISSLVYTGDLLSQPLLPGDGADCYNNNKRTCKGSFFCGAALPFKSVMDFYLCQKKGKAYDVCNLQKTVRKSQNFNESNGWLCSTGMGKYKAYDVCNLQRTVRKSQNFNESNGWLCSTGMGKYIAYDVCNLQRTVRKSQNFNENNGWLCSTGTGKYKAYDVCNLQRTIRKSQNFNENNVQKIQEEVVNDTVTDIKLQPEGSNIFIRTY